MITSLFLIHTINYIYLQNMSINIFIYLYSRFPMCKIYSNIPNGFCFLAIPSYYNNTIIL